MDAKGAEPPLKRAVVASTTMPIAAAVRPEAANVDRNPGRVIVPDVLITQLRSFFHMQSEEALYFAKLVTT